MKSSDTGTMGHTRSPIYGDLPAGFLGETGISLWEKSGSQVLWPETAFLLLVQAASFSTTSWEGFFFTLALNPASSCTCKALSQLSWNSNWSSAPDIQRARLQYRVLHAAPLAKQTLFYLDGATHPHVTHFLLEDFFKNVMIVFVLDLLLKYTSPN